MNVRDETLVEALELLKDLPDGGLIRARIKDDIVASLTPAQRYLFDHWHNYICQGCGKTMVVPDTSRDDYP
jgi:hypothetical protein